MWRVLRGLLCSGLLLWDGVVALSPEVFGPFFYFVSSSVPLSCALWREVCGASTGASIAMRGEHRRGASTVAAASLRESVGVSFASTVGAPRGENKTLCEPLGRVGRASVGPRLLLARSSQPSVRKPWGPRDSWLPCWARALDASCRRGRQGLFAQCGPTMLGYVAPQHGPCVSSCRLQTASASPLCSMMRSHFMRTALACERCFLRGTERKGENTACERVPSRKNKEEHKEHNIR